MELTAVHADQAEGQGSSVMAGRARVAPPPARPPFGKLQPTRFDRQRRRSIPRASLRDLRALRGSTPVSDLSIRLRDSGCRSAFSAYSAV